METYIPTYIHPYMHTCIHTYIYMRGDFDASSNVWYRIVSTIRDHSFDHHRPAPLTVVDLIRLIISPAGCKGYSFTCSATCQLWLKNETCSYTVLALLALLSVTQQCECVCVLCLCFCPVAQTTQTCSEAPKASQRLPALGEIERTFPNRPSVEANHI